MTIRSIPLRRRARIVLAASGSQGVIEHQNARWLVIDSHEHRQRAVELGPTACRLRPSRGPGETDPLGVAQRNPMATDNSPDPASSDLIDVGGQHQLAFVLDGRSDHRVGEDVRGDLVQ